MNRIRRADYKEMPWQNGLGITAEIDRVPGGEKPYLWRFSQASISADAPFSIFAGYDRWVSVWRGDAIFLNERKIAPLTPVRFSGDEITFCRLAGVPVQDVGLIFDRARVDASMRVVDGPVTLQGNCVHYVFDVATGDTMKFDSTAKLSVALSLLVSVWEIR